MTGDSISRNGGQFRKEIGSDFVSTNLETSENELTLDLAAVLA